MAESKEAEQSNASESDQGEFLETEAPGITAQTMLIASDSYENLNYGDIDIDDEQFRRKKAGSIHAIVKQSSVSDVNEVSTGEESDQNEGNTKDLCTEVGKMTVKDSVNPAAIVSQISIPDEEDVGDVNNSVWRQQTKHVFILSEAGKPVYSRYGSEDKLVTIMGVMQALVSVVQDSKDNLRCIIAGDHKFVFLVRDPLLLVGVTCGSDSIQQILLQLSYVHSQVLSVLTHTTLFKIFKQRRNYDLRRLLTGAEKFFDNLLNLIDTEPGFLLGAVRCLPLDSSVREIIAQSIVQHGKVKDLVFGLILANNQLVTLVRMKKYFLHPMDLHLIINLVNASESFKAAESWTPICLPKFDSSGFLQAHVSYLDESCDTCLLLLSVDRESFFALSDCKTRIRERLLKYNALQAIADSLQKTSYSIQQCGIPNLWHFLYKSRSTAQYTSPEREAPYLSQSDQERLFGLYQYLHHRIHTSGRPLKILYHVGPYETLLGWVTQGFELYAVFGPLVTKTCAIHAVNKLLRWIKREEDRLFILNSVTF
ncbi:protein SAND-like [Gigantopelta aegis]|uniref:protein SAND-like n=1 Tax=Gigantopelta aegis TaxID=1735272 RepID=UPI001B887491|nr:protein SAND-like [Gigantopelta aegis]